MYVDTHSKQLSNEVSFLFRGIAHVRYDEPSAVNEADGIEGIR